MGIDLGTNLSRFQAMSSDSALPSVNASNKDKLQESAKEFEAIFVKMMIDSMNKSKNHDNDLIPRNQADDIYEDWLNTEYSRILAKKSDFGIAKAIVDRYSTSH